jgi:hypothetical protein
MRVSIFSACGLRLRIVFCNATQNNWRTVGEFSDEREISAHGLNGLAESGKQQIAALFKARNTVLGDSESLGHANLREFAGVPELAQSHFLRDQLSSASLDLFSLGRALLVDFVIYLRRHGYFLSFFSRAR